MFKKTLLAATAGLLLAFTGLASAADWKSTATATNTGKVVVDGKVANADFLLVGNASASVSATGAAAIGQFTSIGAQPTPSFGGVVMTHVAGNSGAIDVTGVVTNPIYTGVVNGSASVSATGAMAGVVVSGTGLGFAF